MDSQSIWLIILSISTPIAGVVGFGLQLRQVKKARLENEKLQLEIEALKKAAATSEQRIVQVSNDEVARYANRPMFKRQTRNHAPQIQRSRHIKEKINEILIVILVVLFLGYGLYDIYRLCAWLWSKL